MIGPGKVIMAMDESVGTMDKRLTAIGVEANAENRAAWRELIVTAPDLTGVGAEQSGVLLLQPYSSEQDAEIYQSISKGKTLALRKDNFVILFPGEVHSPGIILQDKPVKVRKVVFKVLDSKMI